MISPLPLPDLSISRHIFSRTKHICSIIRKILTTLLLNLKPEILKARPTQKAAPIPHSTTWINGLRGWMSLLVVILHLTSFTYPYFQLCYGAEISPGVYNTSLIAWPLFRLPFVGGQMAVSQFFIISGYVGTKRLLVFLYEEGGKRSNDFMDAVNSAIVRRPLRLYLPVMWSTLFFTSFQQVFNIAKSDITLQPTFLLELQRWTYDMLQFFYFIKDIDGPPLSYYNFHTWTISVEFRGSLLVLVWIFGLRYVKTNVRVLLTLAMILYLTLANAGVLYAATFAGMLTADLDIFSETSTQFELLTTEIPKPFTGTKIPWILRIQRRYSLLRQTILYILLLTSLYLAAQPNDWLGFHASPKSNKTFVLNNCHGWKILSDLIPPVYNHSDSWHHFWLFWSAWMLFVAIKETYIRKFFELRFSQYLGRHSFSLYLIHGPMIGLLSSRLFYLTGVKKPEVGGGFEGMANQWSGIRWWPLPDIWLHGLEPNFLFCAVTSILVFLYVAEMGTKMFDTPSVHISRWVWTKLKKSH